VRVQRLDAVGYPVGESAGVMGRDAMEKERKLPLCVGRAFSGTSGKSKWVEPGYNAIMATRLTIDKAGRVVIPKSLREELRLEPGDSLEMETAGEAITLRPVRGNGQLRKEHGVWVFYGGHALPASATDEMLRQLREERDAANFGNDR
jgi:AbrB family looped-hinge helix DNA binding protein